MKCDAKDCKNEEEGGWIDFGFEGKDLPVARTIWCKKHFDPLWERINALIEVDRKEGKLKEGEEYAIVPPHITCKVLRLGTDEEATK